MKKIIVLAITFLFCLVCSNTVNAQYVYGPRTTSDEAIVQTLNSIANVADHDIKVGQDLLWIGVTADIIGVSSLAVPYFSTKNNMPKDENICKIFYTTGAVMLGVGSVLEIVGIWKIWDGKLDKKGVRISATAAGFIVDF